MKLAVISDSHSAYDELRKFLGFLKREGIHHLVHAGDFVTSDVSDLFAHHPEINCYIAIGNCDYGITLRNLQKMPHVMIDTVVYFELEGKHFAISHIDGVAERALRDQPVDVFFHGHTHTTQIDNHQHPMTINPGSLRDGHGFILMDVPSLDLERRFLFD